jgi:hypothetical protein
MWDAGEVYELRSSEPPTAKRVFIVAYALVGSFPDHPEYGGTGTTTGAGSPATAVTLAYRADDGRGERGTAYDLDGIMHPVHANGCDPHRPTARQRTRESGTIRVTDSDKDEKQATPKALTGGPNSNRGESGTNGKRVEQIQEQINHWQTPATDPSAAGEGTADEMGWIRATPAEFAPGPQ